MITNFNQEIDISNKLVLSWGKYLFPNVDVKSLDDHTIINHFLLELDNSKFEIEVNNIKLSESTFYYYRRGLINSFFRLFNLSKKNLIKSWFTREEEQLVEFAELYLTEKNHIGSLYKERSINKLYNLYIANKCSLHIPKTIVTINKDLLLKKKNEWGKIIVKPLSELKPVFLEGGGVLNPQGTQLIEENEILELDDIFFPSLFQKYEQKQFEIRSFFVYDKFFSMAIFSQGSEKTKIDYRNYNYEYPNRCVPFQLPLTIENRLKKMFKIIDINTGSIDLIVNEKNEYVFLEVNHSGQFDWVSKNCNYYIEEYLANLMFQ